MSSSESITDESSDVIVNLNISETNITLNVSALKSNPKRINEDTSINNIIAGIGLVVVILVVLLILIKVIARCIKKYREDTAEKERSKEPTLMPSPPSTKVVRRNSSVRNSTASTHRSSLNLEFQMALNQKRLSQTISNTPPNIKKS